MKPNQEKHEEKQLEADSDFCEKLSTKSGPETAIHAPLFNVHARRFHILLLLSFGFLCCNLMRSNIAIAINCMVNSTAISSKDEKTYGVHELVVSEASGDSSCGAQQRGEHVVMDYGGNLEWDHQVQNYLLSATFVGSLITVIPSGILLQRYSTRIVLAAAVGVFVPSTLLIPLLANHVGHVAVFLSRLVMGFGEGFILPCMNAIIASWFPTTERSTALAIATAGNQLSSVVGGPLVAALCKSPFGWPAVFYLSGLIGCVWLVVWLCISSNRPSQCKTIKKWEKEYLEANIINRTIKQTRASSVPYGSIVTSLPFLSIIGVQLSVSMNTAATQLYLPTYLREVLLLGVLSNGIFTLVHNLANVVCKILWGTLMDSLKKKGYWTPTKACKISQFVSSYGQAVTFLLLTFVDCSSPYTALLLLVLNACAIGTTTSGFLTALLSVAPRYTPTLSSIGMLFGMVGRLATPMVVAALKKTGSLPEWRSIFYTFAVISFITGTAFQIFASADVQEWGREDEELVTSPVESEMKSIAESERKENDEAEDNSVEGK